MVELSYEELNRDVARILPSTIRDLEMHLKSYLDKCGLFYKCFCRVKSANSVCDKIQRKNYLFTKKKLQDLIGIRIVVYFKNDIRLCEKIIEQHFEVLDVTKDEEKTEVFRPQRINYVCRLPQKMVKNFDSNLWNYPIDQSFEVQIRTIFSEGWHEVEHDFRYKCQEEWINNLDLSRNLNGIFATLDNCDWAIRHLFQEVSYRHYKNREWIPMLKNTFLIRITDIEDMDDILNYFNQNNDVAKQFFRLDREQFITCLVDIERKVPLRMRTIVLLANLLLIKDEYLSSITSEALRDLV